MHISLSKIDCLRRREEQSSIVHQKLHKCAKSLGITNEPNVRVGPDRHSPQQRSSNQPQKVLLTFKIRHDVAGIVSWKDINPSSFQLAPDCDVEACYQELHIFTIFSTCRSTDYESQQIPSSNTCSRLGFWFRERLR